MHIPRSVHDNLHFLISEVGSQVYNLGIYFETHSHSLAKRIGDRSGYTRNLKTNIHNSCLVMIQKTNVESEIGLLRSLEAIATDLDRISELCRDCIHRIGYIKETSHLPSSLYISLLARIGKGIGMIITAIEKSDTQLALKMGRIENKIDCAYGRLLKKHINDLSRKGKKHTADLVSALFVAHAIEQMGDVLLRISETIISANLGQPFSTERYHSFQASVDKLVGHDGYPELALKQLAQTRSGSGISGVSTGDGNGNEYMAIFKDGLKHKVREEREGVESWHEIYPGLAPKILSYHKHGKSAALLIEHLAGLTYEQILLHESPKLLEKATKRLQKTLKSIWQETRTGKPVSANYMKQLKKRLDEVYAVHPEFKQEDNWICGAKITSFDHLLQQALAYEDSLGAPFSVYIHGDFNVDNIIYDPLEKKINFIDLHRSSYMDYVQDISVFMVSNYRLRVVDPVLRQRILQQTHGFYDFASAFSEKANDTSFDLRLALGLARSFATSTRFVLDRTLARAMWLRARYLIERALETAPDQAQHFHLPVAHIMNG
jgi:phosphate uptake regulator/aminoglycoside phosphotransferase